jgi:hypothetical protein
MKFKKCYDKLAKTSGLGNKNIPNPDPESQDKFPFSWIHSLNCKVWTFIAEGISRFLDFPLESWRRQHIVITVSSAPFKNQDPPRAA